MNRRQIMTLGILLGISILASGQEFIAGHEIAHESVLRSIPTEFIDKAREEFVIAYQHTSHGTHVSRGSFGLQDYKEGDNVLFGVSSTPNQSKLEFRDLALESYGPEGVTATDLSKDETAFIQTTRNYLDDADNATVNVVMWAWCNIKDHDVAGNYLPGMDSLIAEYGPGGTKIGSGEGQREVPVHFIFMTGHAIENGNTQPGRPKPLAEVINAHCEAAGHFCLDYYSIDTHDMDGNYYEDAGDNGQSALYGGNFYEDWQNSHVLGEDYYENKNYPENGSVVFGRHNTQHITANRKAYAFWWILARLAGWDGVQAVSTESKQKTAPAAFPNPSEGSVKVRGLDSGVREIQVFGTDGVLLLQQSIQHPTHTEFDLSDYPPGLYMWSMIKENGHRMPGGMIMKL